MEFSVDRPIVAPSSPTVSVVRSSGPATHSRTSRGVPPTGAASTTAKTEFPAENAAPASSGQSRDPSPAPTRTATCAGTGGHLPSAEERGGGRAPGPRGALRAGGAVAEEGPAAAGHDVECAAPALDARVRAYAFVSYVPSPGGARGRRSARSAIVPSLPTRIALPSPRPTVAPPASTTKPRAGASLESVVNFSTILSRFGVGRRAAASDLDDGPCAGDAASQDDRTSGGGDRRFWIARMAWNLDDAHPTRRAVCVLRLRQRLKQKLQ